MAVTENTPKSENHGTYRMLSKRRGVSEKSPGGKDKNHPWRWRDLVPPPLSVTSVLCVAGGVNFEKSGVSSRSVGGVIHQWVGDTKVN